MDAQTVRPHHRYFFSSLKHPKKQQQKPIFEDQRSRDATAPRAGWQSSRRHPAAPPAPTSLLLKAPGAQTGLSGARQVCHKRAAALIEEDVFNVEERQCLPRIRELSVVFFSSPRVTEMTRLIKPANLQRSKQNHPGAGKLPGALYETLIAHRGISRIALLREKDLQLL